MFELSNEHHIELKKYSVLHFFQSLNEPMISPGVGQPARMATATLLALQTRAKAVEIFIGLFFPESGERMIYKSLPFQIELLGEHLPKAQDFTEQMGFLLDTKNFPKLNAEQKADLLRTVPYFYEDIDTFYKSLRDTEIKYRNWRTETSSEASVDNEKVFLEQYLRIVGML